MDIFKKEPNTVSFAAGETIFSDGDSASSMFYVKGGSVDIVFEDRVLETVEEGGIFGEMAIVDSSPRSASAVAKTDAELVEINERRFQDVVKFNPFFALQVLRIAIERLRRETR